MAQPDVESWENVSTGKVLVNKFDGNNQVTQEIVGPGRKTLLTPKERTLLNSDRTYSVEDDIFQNGRLRPITLTADSEGIQENPNHMTAGDMRALFEVRNWMKFKSEVAEISSDSVLRMMIDMVDSDEGDLNPTVKQRETLQERLDQIEGKATVEVEQAGDLGYDEGRSMVGKFRAE